MSTPAQNVDILYKFAGSFPQSLRYVEVTTDPGLGIVWFHLRADAPAKFTPELLGVLQQLQVQFERHLQLEVQVYGSPKIHYQVLASRIPGIFSLGGDLELLEGLIRTQDERRLREYAEACVRLVHRNSKVYDDLPFCTISLIQGTTLGGGFEAALAADVVVAEEQALLGFPEILFNLFPGMGGLSLLARRITIKEAQRLVESGHLYTAKELYEMGVIDCVAARGRGEAAVLEYIKRRKMRVRGNDAIRRAIQLVRPIQYEELQRITEIWVEAALNLGDRDLQVMSRLAKAQSAKATRATGRNGSANQENPLSC